MPLTDVQIKQTNPQDKDLWLSDEKGLRLLVKTNGSKYWRLKYRFQGKQKTLAVGVYPEVSLKEARIMVADARQLLKNNIDPSTYKKEQKLTNDVDNEMLFSTIALDWWQKQKGKWKEDHASRVWTRLNDNALSKIGARPINELRPQEIIAVVQHIEKRGALDVAQRVLQDIGRVCRYAVQTGLLVINPASDLSGVLTQRISEHRASLPRAELAQFLKDLNGYTGQGRLLTKLAIELLIYSFVRPGELLGARWDEFDLVENIWRIPAGRMKMKTDHIVPLSDQAIDTLNMIKPISGRFEFLFPSERDRFKRMSDNTMRMAIFRLGYDGNTVGKSKVNPHGFRATASSILNESGFNPDAIERQLSHMERNGVRAAYTHHARYLEERREMMQWWADYLTSQRTGGKVTPIFTKRA
ncbi:integrase arm-type DNA-binding domain-containing protein [Paraglaciecola sp.]|uniref:tyrosine-type recombinase/integrase n=1 Tax=Paraglaciecola sp. TaxID=1920173 RepID=UPI0030F42F0C